ncbi:MAG TPA: hypothetical protein VI636_15055 [Candidatus Angelobacter sp.]
MQLREKFGELIFEERGAPIQGQPAPIIYDTTLRDGEQMPGIALRPEQKLEIAIALARIGVRIIDVGFPASSLSDRQALSLILEAKLKGQIPEDVEILAMCRAVPQDIDAALAVVGRLAMPSDSITLLIFTSASGLHVKYKIGDSLLARAGRPRSEMVETPLDWFRAQNISLVQEAIGYALSKGATKIEFGAEDASRTPPADLIPLVRAAVAGGATRYIFADTTGGLTPERTASYCEKLRAAFPKLPLVAHFHNDFDLATINTITAYVHGMSILSVTVNGVGERAGNAPLHSVVAALKLRYGIDIPGFRYELLGELSKVVSASTHVPISRNEPVIGANAFAHESGIHVQAILRDPSMYEIINPESVGATRTISYGKHSGIAGVRSAIERNHTALHIASDEISPDLIAKIVDRVKEASEIKHRNTNELDQLIMTENEVLAIAEDTIAQERAERSPTRGATGNMP